MSAPNQTPRNPRPTPPNLREARTVLRWLEDMYPKVLEFSSDASLAQIQRLAGQQDVLSILRSHVRKIEENPGAFSHVQSRHS